MTPHDRALLAIAFVMFVFVIAVGYSLWRRDPELAVAWGCAFLTAWGWLLTFMNLVPHAIQE